MNIGGGEAADQLVRMMLTGTEAAVRLSGSVLKNLLALTMALAQNRKVLSGKVNMGKMLRETRDLRRFPMTLQQYKQFRKLAKKHKLLYSVIRDKDERGKLMEVILPVTELDRANAIFERILYTLPLEQEREPARERRRGREVLQPERQPPERHTSEREQEEKAVSGSEKAGQEAPGNRSQENTPKKDSRSERDSPVIRISSSTLKENGVTKGTSERPSVEARLRAYQAQMKKSSVPAKTREKTKVSPKQR